MGRGIAVVTGASSGIGAATAVRLTAEGFEVVLGARRLDRLADVADRCGPTARTMALDVTDDASVAAFCAACGPEVAVLVDNAGGALGLDRVEDADLDGWRSMFETNVLGVVRVTRALLPALEASGSGVVIVVGSVAGFEPYEGGAGYNAAKHAVRAVRQVLRYELLGRPVRITEVDPGMVAGTEFSEVRFGGDAARAAKVYAGVHPLVAEDVAECIAFVATRPPHVVIDELVVRPRDQASAQRVNRAT